MVKPQVKSGQYVDLRLGRTTVAAWADKWIKSLGPPTLKPKTVESYKSLLRSRVLPIFGSRRLATIRPSDVQQWVSSMGAEGLSASRIRQAAVTLGQLLEAAVKDGMIGRNPVAGMKLPRLPHREAAYFEPDVVDKIADEIDGSYGLLIRVLGTVGLRWGEAAALRRRHVDLLRRRLHVEGSLAELSGRLIEGSTKSHAVRSVPLSPGLAAALERHLQERVGPERDAYLFTAPNGGPLRYSNFHERVWMPALDRLGVARVGLHVLRHSAAARLIAAGASPKAVQSIMGHRSAAFSLTVYGHLFEADLDALAERLDSGSRVRNVSRLEERRQAKDSI